jgi:TetR/AcrR family transcriptional regulator, transcriptional repressor for nem operon
MEMGRNSDAKERLLSCAGELIYALGYQRMSVEELCECARVKKGSFYHFFPSKQELTLAAIDVQWNIQRNRLVEPAFASNLPPLERIQCFFDLMAEACVDEWEKTGQVRGGRFGNLVAEMGGQSSQIREKVLSIFQALVTYFEQALEEAISSGVISNINPHMTALALLSYMEGMLLIGRTYNDANLVKQLACLALQFTLARASSSSIKKMKPEQPS